MIADMMFTVLIINILLLIFVAQMWRNKYKEELERNHISERRIGMYIEEIANLQRQLAQSRNGDPSNVVTNEHWLDRISRAETDARANEKALMVLARHLDKAQLDDLSENETFTIAVESGTVYRLSKSKTGGVDKLDKHGNLVARYCLQVGDNKSPIYDIMLARMLLLKTNEKLFLKKANVTSITSMPISCDTDRFAQAARRTAESLRSVSIDLRARVAGLHTLGDFPVHDLAFYHDTEGQRYMFRIGTESESSPTEMTNALANRYHLYPSALTLQHVDRVGDEYYSYTFSYPVNAGRTQ